MSLGPSQPAVAIIEGPDSNGLSQAWHMSEPVFHQSCCCQTLCCLTCESKRFKETFQDPRACLSFGHTGGCLLNRKEKAVRSVTLCAWMSEHFAPIQQGR